MKLFARGRKSLGPVEWAEASDISKRAKKLILSLDMDWIIFPRIFFYRSNNSKARAYARTWGLPKLWQKSLSVEPAYIIEVLAEHFDKLDVRNQDKVILHELTHIPKNFSGALLPHTKHRKGSFHDTLEKLYANYNSSRG